MEELISKLVRKYQADMITWHDIQDIVDAYVIQADGEGATTNWEVMRVRFEKSNAILQEIERRIQGGESDES